MEVHDYVAFLPEVDFLVCFLAACFLGGLPVFGWASNASTSVRRSSLRPAIVTVDKRPRLIKSAIACRETLRSVAASVCEIY